MDHLSNHIHLVSVVITCFNYGKYLRHCIESVLGQTYTDFEIIVVNDGSTDNTEEIMNEYLAHPRIIYIKQQNSGQTVAKNLGIKQSSGSFVAFLDADDLWCCEKLEKQMALFARKDVAVAFSKARYINEEGEEIQNFKLSGKYLIPRAGKVTDFLLFDNFIPFSSAVVRRECLKRVGAFDESLKMGIDWDLWLRISTGYEFAFVDEPLLSYRIGHSGQMSKNGEERQRCADRIRYNFIHNNQGLVSPQTIKKAYAYAYCNRGYYFRNIDRSKSSKYYLAAIKLNPTKLNAYKGLLINALDIVS